MTSWHKDQIVKKFPEAIVLISQRVAGSKKNQTNAMKTPKRTIKKADWYFVNFRYKKYTSS